MDDRLTSIPLKNIAIRDDFWNRYIDLVRNVIIPYQWDILNDLVKDAEPSHCIHNFKVAAGMEEGEFQGAIFQDTDVAKWLEAVAYSLECHPDERLEKLADETIELIGKAQGEDGYLNTYFTIKEPGQRWKNLQEGHELYTAGHMMEAAVAYYEATGKKRFLMIVSRLADLICERFGPRETQCHGYPGHQEIELALMKLYRVTGEKKYADLSKYFIDRRGTGDNYFLEEMKNPGRKAIFSEFSNYDTKYSQSHLPVREQETAEGHAVRAVYMYCAMADVAGEYRDEELLKACRRIWKNMVGKRMYLTGGIGSSGILERFTVDYDLPNDCNYGETCASIGLALFGRRMAELEKDASYVEILERALYNTVLSGIAMDGKSFFYVNPLEVWPDNCMPRTSKEHIKPVRQKWFGVACCPPNIARTLASMGQYLYMKDDSSLYVNLYISNETDTVLSGEDLRVTIHSELPVNGRIKVEAKSKGERKKCLAFRIPSYAVDFKITDSRGKEVPWTPQKGYACVEGYFADELLFLTFDEKAMFVRANPLVRADVGKVAVMKGPRVYCLEETDNGGNLASVYLDTSREIKEVFEEGMMGGTLTLILEGKRIEGEAWGDTQLYGDKKVVWKDVTLKAVPYSGWGNREPGEMLVWMKELF